MCVCGGGGGSLTCSNVKKLRSDRVVVVGRLITLGTPWPVAIINFNCIVIFGGTDDKLSHIG